MGEFYLLYVPCLIALLKLLEKVPTKKQRSQLLQFAAFPNQKGLSLVD
jgi:hypothetical protein